MKAIQHFKTITQHKILVMKGCFRVGLYKQGLLHDMSKYSPAEFLIGAKYYQGDQSPNNIERLKTGVSLAWLHHKGRNKHHYEYWIDYSIDLDEGMVGMEMPIRYVVEMFIDRVSAGKIYKKELYNDKDPWLYYEKSRGMIIMHPKTKALLEKLLHMLEEEGEAKTFDYIKYELLKNKGQS